MEDLRDLVGFTYAPKLFLLIFDFLTDPFLSIECQRKRARARSPPLRAEHTNAGGPVSTRHESISHCPLCLVHTCLPSARTTEDPLREGARGCPRLAAVGHARPLGAVPYVLP